MAPRANRKPLDIAGQELIQELIQERLKYSIQYTFITVIEEEVEAFLYAALYQRTPNRRGHRNGHYEWDLVTTLGLIEDLQVPRTRKELRTELFECYQRCQEELDEAICEMFVRGVSTAQVGQVVEALTGTNPSLSTVSRIFHSLDEDFENWKQRKLGTHYLYAFADGTYFTVIYDHEACKMPILAVVGIDEDGKRDVQAFSVGERENQSAWEDLLEKLKSRGVETVDLWVTDGNRAMMNTIEKKFPGSQRQRCIKHKM